MPVATKQPATADTSLSITRLFNATPDRIFDAWLDPSQLAAWIGPKSFDVSAHTLLLEPHVGGKYRIEMVTPAGRVMTVGGVYRQITRASSLIFTWNWEHENRDTLITLNLRPLNGKTELHLLHENFASAERRDSHNTGWPHSLQQLEAFLNNQPFAVTGVQPGACK